MMTMHVDRCHIIMHSQDNIYYDLDAIFCNASMEHLQVGRNRSFRDATESEQLATAIGDVEDVNLHELYEAVNNKLPTSSEVLLKDSNEVREMMANIASLQLRLNSKLHALQAKMAHEELNQGPLMQPIVTPHVSADAIEVPASKPTSTDNTVSSMTNKPTFASVTSAAASSSAPAAGSSSKPSPPNLIPVDAVDHHKALLWTDDVPSQQMNELWDEHTNRFPDCLQCKCDGS